MKYLTYILRNARRNPVRTCLTVASLSICLFLMMFLVSLMSINDDIAASSRAANRIMTISAQGFAQPVPIARVREIEALDGVVAVSPMSWFGGKFRGNLAMFAQFGVDADTFLDIYDEMHCPPEQLKAWQEDRTGCIIGTKLADDYDLKVGDPMPLEGDIYPINLNLTIRGIYDGPSNRDRRMVLFHWDYMDEQLRQIAPDGAGNAGAIVIKCKSGDLMVPLSRQIDELYKNSDSATKTQTEEAFIKMFQEMVGDLKLYIFWVGLAVLFALICVASVSMAMAMRERTTEVAVLKAIGFSKSLVLGLVLVEAVLVASLGGLIGALGTKLLFDYVDISPYTMGFFPFFYVPWATALTGLAGSVLIGLASGIIPAVRASTLSVIDGLRKVV